MIFLDLQNGCYKTYFLVEIGSYNVDSGDGLRSLKSSSGKYRQQKILPKKEITQYAKQGFINRAFFFLTKYKWMP